MMDIYYSYGAVFAALTALAGAGISFHLYSRKQTARMVELYKKLETSETSSRRAKEQLLRVQEEAVNLKHALERERRVREEAATGYQESARKKLTSIGAVCIAAGVFMGSAVSGMLVYSISETSHLRQSIDLQVRARLGEEKAEILAGQLARVQEDNQRLYFNLFTSRETEAVTQAKMEVLLDNLSGKRVNSKLLLDVEALRSSLRQQEDAGLAQSDLMRPQAAVRI